MIEIAEVFRPVAAANLAAHGASMPPSHRRAIADILDCRTAALGGQVWRCEACSTEVFSYHTSSRPTAAGNVDAGLPLGWNNATRRKPVICPAC